MVMPENPFPAHTKRRFGDEKALEEEFPDFFKRKQTQKLRWQKKGPPYYRVPGSRRIVYDLDEVRAWLTSQRIEPVR
jgi:hypothetical protein